jgi:hypothetical protein
MMLGKLPSNPVARQAYNLKAGDLPMSPSVPGFSDAGHDDCFHAL